MFTCDGECNQRSDLPLQAVGGDAGVVPGVAAGHFGEVKLPVPLLHVLRQLSPVCRGRQRHRGQFVLFNKKRNLVKNLENIQDVAKIMVQKRRKKVRNDNRNEQ